MLLLLARTQTVGSIADIGDGEPDLIAPSIVDVPLEAYADGRPSRLPPVAPPVGDLHTCFIAASAPTMDHRRLSVSDHDTRDRPLWESERQPCAPRGYGYGCVWHAPVGYWYTTCDCSPRCCASHWVRYWLLALIAVIAEPFLGEKVRARVRVHRSQSL